MVLRASVAGPSVRHSPNPILRQLALLVAAATLLTGLAKADTFVAELELEDGGSQRVLYAAPERPRAALIMLPGASGMVEIGMDGTIRRMRENFLLRTLPLWQAQGFAVVALSPPNGMSLLGHRHTAAYAATIGQAIDLSAAELQLRCGWSAPARVRPPRSAAAPGSAAGSPALSWPRR